VGKKAFQIQRLSIIIQTKRVGHCSVKEYRMSDTPRVAEEHIGMNGWEASVIIDNAEIPHVHAFMKDSRLIVCSLRPASPLADADRLREACTKYGVTLLLGSRIHLSLTGLYYPQAVGVLQNRDGVLRAARKVSEAFNFLSQIPTAPPT